MSGPIASEPRSLCDHRCLLDPGHIDRHELHQYGYVMPPDVPVGEHERLVSEAGLIERERCVNIAKQTLQPPVGWTDPHDDAICYAVSMIIAKIESGENPDITAE